MDETTIEGDLTVQDILDEANAAPYNTLLKIWQKILEPAEEERAKPITPQWAARIVNTYPRIDYTDMVVYRDLYFERVGDLKAVLDAIVESDPECLNPASAEEDVEQNQAHYLNTLFDWQRLFLLWELEWDCTRATAAVEIAATAELHKMFFSADGVTALLDQIGFEFTDEDRQALADALEELRESTLAGVDEVAEEGFRE